MKSEPAGPKPDTPSNARPTPAPALSTEAAGTLADTLFDIRGRLTQLGSYSDQNVLVETEDGSAWVLKIANAAESRVTLDLQNSMMRRIRSFDPTITPHVRKSVNGNEIEEFDLPDGSHFVRMVSFLPGPMLSEAKRINERTWQSLGAFLGRIDSILEGFEHPGIHRELRWDLGQADWTLGRLPGVSGERRNRLERFQLQFLGSVLRQLPELPHSLIHNDANCVNLVVDEDRRGSTIRGIFDFGDAIYTARVFEIAIAATYAMFGQDEPIEVLSSLARGYNRAAPFQRNELEALFPAICMRLVTSLTISSEDAALDPNNEHIRASETGAWDLVARLSEIDPIEVEKALVSVCDLGSPSRQPVPSAGTAAEFRNRHLGSSLSLSYRHPLEIVRGRGTYLFDTAGRSYLDCVNNVCHVGHCHPRVVEAAAAQMATLNTNTRYLHQNVGLYAQRLAGLFPDPLEVCFFVNSGSEANELALRLAQTFTARRDMIVLGGGYHGNSSSLVDLSPYKHAGPGGRGAPDWVHPVSCPDVYRGPFRGEGAAAKYAGEVAQAIAAASKDGREIAGILAEALIGCGGQIQPPAGYFKEVYAAVRAAGGVCIADEVQVGFGRVGSHFWAFETHGVVPDIVTLGKPIGNGHPLGAVVTTRAIADAFDNGMEYFNTFGGNPVSAAVGLAVLDVIEEEGLQRRAGEVGAQLLDGLSRIGDEHECVGDVRGVGLYLGLELVRDRRTKEPWPERLGKVIEICRDRGVLTSSDGPDQNVLKLKPPLSFGEREAKLFLTVFGAALSESQ